MAWFENEGVHRCFLVGPPVPLPPTIGLTPAGSVPRGMVKIPAGDLAMVLTGYDYNKTIPAARPTWTSSRSPTRNTRSLS